MNDVERVRLQIQAIADQEWAIINEFLSNPQNLQDAMAVLQIPVEDKMKTYNLAFVQFCIQLILREVGLRNLATIDIEEDGI